jgi:hypothetical protein
MYVLYYASMLRCWHLVWILVMTNHRCLGVGCHIDRQPSCPREAIEWTFEAPTCSHSRPSHDQRVIRVLLDHPRVIHGQWVF